jgi:hypothetical protein
VSGTSTLSNVILSIEQQADWLANLLDHVNLRAGETLYPKAESYYVGAEIADKLRVFMPYSGGVRAYRLDPDWCLKRSPILLSIQVLTDQHACVILVNGES